jgi:hypothetical protein
VEIGAPGQGPRVLLMSRRVKVDTMMYVAEFATLEEHAAADWVRRY